MRGSRKRLRRYVSMVALVAVATLPYISAHCLTLSTTGFMAARSTGVRHDHSGTTQRWEEPRSAPEPFCCVSAVTSIASMPSRLSAAHPIWVSIGPPRRTGAVSLNVNLALASERDLVHPPPAYLRQERLLI